LTARFAALDLGSGTIKLSVFERTPGGFIPLCLDELNTELRKGMGEERTLKAGPIADTVAACTAFLKLAQGLGVARVPAYGTSALRKAQNPEALFEPLEALGIATCVLSEEEEGRLNLLGAQGHQEGKGLLVLDPGGDSSECCGGDDWRTAPVASLPFGSVSLQERFGTRHDNDPIPWRRLQETTAFAKAAALGHPNFAGFAGQGLMPAIRMNLPIQRALEQVNGLPKAAHGAGGTYTYQHLEALSQAVAATDHAGRTRMMDGEPLGKVDRSCYGFASWLGVLQALEAESFIVEPWGIKLGAAKFLNGKSD
jgi:exopolyphosphatase/guanosine-5'-triphosphate,3'-diphosphate pyrophosphatase